MSTTKKSYQTNVHVREHTEFKLQETAFKEEEIGIDHFEKLLAPAAHCIYCFCSRDFC